MGHPRVVVTGLGTVNPVGNNVKDFWVDLVRGKSGIRKITTFNVDELPCRVAGLVEGFDPLDYLDRKTAQRVPRSTQFAVAAARQALDDANLSYPMSDPGRAGVMVGTGVAGVDQILDAYDVFKARGYSKMKPYAVPGGIPNIPAFLIAREFQCLGPNSTTTTACAAGTQAIGEGAEYIRRGHADVVLAGGTEAVVHPLVVATFSVMRAIPFNFNDQPDKASRPFNIDREGFVLSEGAAILVLESLEHAVSRGARIYAEILGHASSSDGYDIAAMIPDGAGAIRAMKEALRDAGVQPKNIDYINAHGTSTPLNDKTETSAIKRVFGDSAYKIPVSSTKSMLGHAMGASGAIEALICVMAINTGIIPPTINYENPDPECDLNYVPNTALHKSIEISLSNSFGLGGQNACLVLKSYNQAESSQ